MIMNPSGRLREMSLADLAALGLQGVAYIRPALVDGMQAFSIFAADGTPIGVVPTLEIARAALREHDLEEVTVH
jgi:hypothetical protein